jgi:hypothetical protein
VVIIDDTDPVDGQADDQRGSIISVDIGVSAIAI